MRFVFKAPGELAMVYIPPLAPTDLAKRYPYLRARESRVIERTLRYGGREAITRDHSTRLKNRRWWKQKSKQVTISDIDHLVSHFISSLLSHHLVSNAQGGFSRQGLWFSNSNDTLILRAENSMFPVSQLTAKP